MIVFTYLRAFFSCSLPDGLRNHFKSSLNPSQIAALQISAVASSGLTLIQGPPGTGKKGRRRKRKEERKKTKKRKRREEKWKRRKQDEK